MSSRASLIGNGSAFAIAAGIVTFSALVGFKPSLAQMGQVGGTTSIRNDSEKAREMKQPSFQTREERLNAKPLDWNSTIGTPTPRALTAKERKASEGARRGSSEGRAPNPKAEEEARKLHPDDWK